MSAIWAVVPAAGSGSRLAADRPKQYLQLRGKPLLDWSLAALLASDRLQACVVALAEREIAAANFSLRDDPRVRLCIGGASRAESVAAGLAAIDGEDDDWVLVHDAARPCLPLADLETLIDSCLASGLGALLAQPVAETLKRAAAVEHGKRRVLATVDRADIWRAQTPQMFPLGALREALAEALAAGYPVTDEASAMERAGHPVHLVEGSAANLKVTYPADLALAEFWLGLAGQQGVEGASS